MNTTKVSRKSVKGELYNGKDFVGSIVQVEGGYQVWKIEYGYGSPILEGKTFSGKDFRKAGTLDLGYGIVRKYKMVA